ncbi:MAG: 1-acyl-sn-glycerol-3-phosphate acyltransferase [Crocinitomicaceae bacterium]|nr:1-acyl-sn-glycerol-3-phosphate acyltransferase [Crocinitomicaceae bacterium]
MDQKDFIDIRKLVASKSPKLAKFIPGFVYRYLKRIIHQDDINEFMGKYGELKNDVFCSTVVEQFELKIESYNLDNIPSSGGVILVMNHPLGGMDAMALIHLLKDKRKDIRFIVNDLLLNLTPIKDLFVGVNKHGSNSRKLPEQMDELFASDKVIGIFPAGLVSRRKKGKIEDLEWKKAFVKYARSYNKTIIPIYIDGKLSNFFYNLSNFREFIRLKVNIEMLYLSDELFNQKGKSIKFVVGEPFKLEDLKDIKSDKKIAEAIKNKVYQLKNQIND